MKIKDIWSDSDFADMGWDQSRLYSIAIPDENFKLVLDIDYIFKWQREGSSYSGFWVSPCNLIFHNVSGFKSEIDYKDNNLLFVSEIRRSNERLTPNKMFTAWDYEIECDNGSISFSATGFEQTVRKQPVLSETLDLNKNR